MGKPTAHVLLNRLRAHARFRHLHALVRVAELGTIKGAAKAIGMTQPAVTYLLSDLERMFEAPLFVRHARGVRLTPLCEHLLPLAQRMLRTLGDAADTAATRSDSRAAVVRLLSSIAAVNGLLSRAVPKFFETHPAIRLQLVEANLDLLATATIRTDIDLVCRRQLVPDQLDPVPHGWIFEPLVHDRLVVVCDPGHSLTRRRRLTLRDLQNETWLPLPVETGARSRFDELMTEHEISPRTCPVYATSTAILWAMLNQHGLITMVPLSVVRPLIEAGQLKVLPLEEKMPFGSLGMMHPVENSGTPGATFAEFLRTFVASQDW